MSDMMRRMGRLGGRSISAPSSTPHTCTHCGVTATTTAFQPHQLSNGTGDYWRWVCSGCHRWEDVAVHVPEWPGWERREARRVDGVVVPEALSSARRRWRAEAARLLDAEGQA